MNEWPEFYKQRVNSPSYFEYFCKKYKVFLKEIIKHTPNYTYGIGEFGCGIGTTSKYLLAKSKHKQHLLDNNERMLEMAKQNLSNHTTNQCSYSCQDITKKPQHGRYDLIHSHGVLEHFSDSDIINILTKQASLTDVIIHYVPTNGYTNPSFGDERLMPVERWADILSDFNPHLIPFNEGKDLIIKIIQK